jgi:hypothetical protein
LFYAIIAMGALLFARSATSLGILLIAAIGMGVLLLARSPAQPSRIDKAARRLVRERLSQGERKTPADIISAWSIAPMQANSARVLLEALEATLEVPFGNITPDDRLGHVFRVRLIDLPEISEQVWKNTGLHQTLEVFGTDILYVVEKQSTKPWWSSRHRALNPSPKNEDQWIDAIMNMSARQFLEFFAMPDKT